MLAPTTASATSRRKLTTDKLTQRKRAPIACQFCRLRETKCGGAKPVCGLCLRHNAQCIWGVATTEIESTPAEKEILQHLDELKELLSDTRSNESPSNSWSPSKLNAHAGNIHEQPASPVAASQGSFLEPLTPLGWPFAYSRSEKILAWPIFYGVADIRDASTESFVLDYGVTNTMDKSGLVSSSAMIERSHNGCPEFRMSRVVPLCHKFLAHVHSRNPILDEMQLLQYTEHVVVHGLEWDGLSCLVMIACAIACYTALWRIPPDNPDISDAASEDVVSA